MKGHPQCGRFLGRVLNCGPSEYIAEALKLDVTYYVSLKVLLKYKHGSNVPHKHSVTYDLLITGQTHIDTLKTEEEKVELSIVTDMKF
jgi:hypothetical protein